MAELRDDAFALHFASDLGKTASEMEERKPCLTVMPEKPSSSPVSGKVHLHHSEMK